MSANIPEKPHYEIERQGAVDVVIPMQTMEHLHDSLMDQTVSSIVAHLSSAKPVGFVIDLSRIGYCNSVFISFLLRCRMLAKRQDMEMVLAAPSAAVQQLLQILDLESIWSIYSSRQEAVEAVQHDRQVVDRRLDELA